MLTQNYHRKLPKKINWKLVLGVFVFVALVVGGVYIAVFSPYPKVKSVTIEGGEKISSDEARGIVRQLMDERWLGFVPMDSIFVISGQKIKNVLFDKYPEVKSVNMIKKLPASMLVQIVERKEAVHYCNNGKCFLLDNEGVAFEETIEMYGGLKVCLRDTSVREIKIREKILEPKTINFLVNTQKLLFEKVNLNLVYFEINSYPIADVATITSGDWKIIFDPNRDPKDQINALRQVLDEKIKDQRDSLEYIDLRVEGRVYYRFREIRE